MEFHQKLKQLREENGLSQIDLATTIGVAKSTYSLYEAGKREPDVQKIKKIAIALKTTPDELLDIQIKKIESLNFSADTIEVARQYEQSSLEIKNGVRRFLSLSEVDFIKNDTKCEIAKDMADMTKAVCGVNNFRTKQK